MQNNLVYVIILINIITFIMYGVDKFKSKLDFYRISEKTLLTLSVMGGLGGFAGMQVFRHKTRKSIFYLANFIGIAVSVYLLTQA